MSGNNLGSMGAHVLESCIHGVRCIASLDISDSSTYNYTSQNNIYLYLIIYKKSKKSQETFKNLFCINL